MTKILVATENENKLAEIRRVLADNGVTGWELISLAEYPDYEAPEENGETFKANAIIKAASAADMSGLIAMADDSGLAVDALDGRPGVHSARYAGDHDDAGNRAKLLRELEGIPQERRAARFVCAAALAFPENDGEGNIPFWTTEGVCEGQIAFEERGSNGFGYDSLFYLPQYGRTMAELTPEQKNAVSHRGNAFTQVANLLNYLSDNSLDF